MKTWPALDARGIESDFLIAELDDFAPTAVEDQGHAVRVFFPTSEARNRALACLAAHGVAASPADVSDEDWARRSQESITPISVGRIVITPPWHAGGRAASVGLHGAGSPLQVVILPSMGFGTGHHATTRLCLAALQTLDLSGKDVLDVGTGSGVLAVSARMLGARHATGIDNDPDAIQSARESLGLNPDASDVAFEIVDLSSGVGSGVADVVIANLTGALLQRAAPTLLTAARKGSTIIVSGLLVTERPSVEGAFSSAQLVQAWEEDEWVALEFRT